VARLTAAPGSGKRVMFEVQSWRDIDFAGVVLAGLVAGYVMAIAGLWAGKVPGLVSFDIADYGRRYMVSDRPSAWLLGFVSHLVNSILLVYLWASLIEPNLGLPRPLSGLAWGWFLALTLAGSIVMPLSGAGFMGSKTGSYRLALTTLLLHAVWGLLIGLVYVPPR
jgi:hypothetical protein